MAVVISISIFFCIYVQTYTPVPTFRYIYILIGYHTSMYMYVKVGTTFRYIYIIIGYHNTIEETLVIYSESV